jgi:hypothetical protein
VRFAWRQDLEEYLAGFVAGHRGLRFGRMFGMPAGYAGRRLFSCVFEDGITAKLPPQAMAAARKHGATPWNPIARGATAKPKPRRMNHWVIFRPRTRRAADAVGPFLEIAARHVAIDVSRPRGSKIPPSESSA